MSSTTYFDMGRENSSSYFNILRPILNSETIQENTPSPHFLSGSIPDRRFTRTIRYYPYGPTQQNNDLTYPSLIRPLMKCDSVNFQCWADENLTHISKSIKKSCYRDSVYKKLLEPI